MYSNTIYILNNTIIECFDIAFNKKKKREEKKKKNKRKNPLCVIPDYKKRI